MVYDDCKIYGPYLRKDGRKHVVTVTPDGKKTTVSYPKYLIEIHIGRYLTQSETADHMDGDFTNDEISNLCIKDRKKHIIEDVRRLAKQSFICPICNEDFDILGKKLHDAIQFRKQGKAGPFCSKSCAGKYGKSIQLGADKLPVQEITPVYTTNKLLQSPHGETHEVDAAKTGNP